VEVLLFVGMLVVIIDRCFLGVLTCLLEVGGEEEVDNGE
jgi:hypothetical protein